METLTNDDFQNFLKSFKNKTFRDENGFEHNFYDSLTELSKSNTEPYDELINNDFHMFALDWMVKASFRWRDLSKQCKKILKDANIIFLKVMMYYFAKNLKMEI